MRLGGTWLCALLLCAACDSSRTSPTGNGTTPRRPAGDAALADGGDGGSGSPDGAASPDRAVDTGGAVDLDGAVAGDATPGDDATPADARANADGGTALDAGPPTADATSADTNTPTADAAASDGNTPLSDDEQGFGSCSSINGAVFQPGTYYVRVRHPAGGTVTYFLDLTLLEFF